MPTTKLELSRKAAPHIRHEKILSFCEENVGSVVNLVQLFNEDTPWNGTLLGSAILTMTGHSVVLVRVKMPEPSIRAIHFERVVSIEVAS